MPTGRRPLGFPPRVRRRGETLGWPLFAGSHAEGLWNEGVQQSERARLDRNLVTKTRGKGATVNNLRTVYQLATPTPHCPAFPYSASDQSRTQHVASLDHNLIEPLEPELLKCQIAVTVEQLSNDENVKPGYFIVRILFFALMVACNAGVWTLFVKALQNVESSLTATVTSAASNYCLSAVTGFFVFGEVTTLIWWSGMSLIICGLLLVVKDQPEEHVAKKQD
ncbi:hypothetical protein GEV33_008082 [Tenebrio molitor]|uniref:EamA domain-containing protein n=1 Tax=Tenebrio molitor TaxID=7067 RepID=A0A8J6HHX7_TENMO|nr:hypothetical protein GEV33_008082 [Tenebrio molitor]